MGTLPKLRGLLRPHEKRVRKEVSLNCRFRERAPLLQH